MPSAAEASPEVAEESQTQSSDLISNVTTKLEGMSTSSTKSSPNSPSSSSSNTAGSEDSESASTPQTLPSSPVSELSSEIHDLICVGFGPASLSIAIALHDTYASSNSNSPPPRCLYLEKQRAFGWHTGMQLPSTKMQISFLKDLATPRQPTSPFTFLNYLWTKGRMDEFINLSTFLPSRREYEDYLKWCASKFEERDEVEYAVGVTDVRPCKRENGKVVTWDVRGNRDGEPLRWETRNVVIAVGGKGEVPQHLIGLENIYHSSEYAHRISNVAAFATSLQQTKKRNLRFAVIGGGQSAAEIFNDLWDRFPEADVKLIIKGSSLRPSDDSPFQKLSINESVNEIFNPSRVSTIYSLPPTLRSKAIAQDRGTNYSVVRLTLLEHLYEKLYDQRISSPDESQWRCRILANRVIERATALEKDGEQSVMLRLGLPKELKRLAGMDGVAPDEVEEEMEVDYVFTATGYLRDAHESMLASTTDLLPQETDSRKAAAFPVARDYRVMFDEQKVDESAGIWLQGCNEGTHGLSDTLLSILAVRGGELVQSIFGKRNVVKEKDETSPVI